MEDINISYGVQVLGPDEDPQIKWTRIRKPFPFFFFFFYSADLDLLGQRRLR